MSRILALAYRIFLQLVRDKRTLVLIFLGPIVIMGLLTWLLKAEKEPIRTAVIAGDKDSEMMSEILGGLLAGYAKVELIQGIKEDEIMDSLKSRKINTAILVQGGGIDNLQEGNRAQIEVFLEGSDPMMSREFLEEFRRIQKPLLDTLQGVLFLSSDNLGMILPPEFNLRFLYGGENFDETDYLAPGVICFVAFFFVFIITAVSFLRERAQGTMERLCASPLSEFEVIIGYWLGFLVFAILQTGVILFFVLYILKIHYLGNLASILLVEFIVVIGASNMGIFFSSFAKNEFQVAQFVPLVILPQVFLSGLLWSIETMPKALQYLAYCLPLTYANLALRDIMVKGFGLAQVLWELLALLAFALIMIFASRLTMRRIWR